MIKFYNMLVLFLLFNSCSNGDERLRAEEKILNERIEEYSGKKNHNWFWIPFPASTGMNF